VARADSDAKISVENVSSVLLQDFLFENSLTRDIIAIMAVSTLPPSELTDEQVEDMLARAAQRLREKSTSTVAKSESFTIPKLDTSKLDIVPTPVSAKRFGNVDLKKIDDPLQTSKPKQEVSNSLPIRSISKLQ
jgi:hypothetical protein